MQGRLWKAGLEGSCELDRSEDTAQKYDIKQIYKYEINPWQDGDKTLTKGDKTITKWRYIKLLQDGGKTMGNGD